MSCSNFDGGTAPPKIVAVFYIASATARQGDTLPPLALTATCQECPRSLQGTVNKTHLYGIDCHNMYLLSIHWIDCIKQGDNKKKNLYGMSFVCCSTVQYSTVQ
jgi:hypothetical protein